MIQQHFNFNCVTAETGPFVVTLIFYVRFSLICSVFHDINVFFGIAHFIYNRFEVLIQNITLNHLCFLFVFACFNIMNIFVNCEL